MALNMNHFNDIKIKYNELSIEEPIPRSLDEQTKWNHMVLRDTHMMIKDGTNYWMWPKDGTMILQRRSVHTGRWECTRNGVGDTDGISMVEES